VPRSIFSITVSRPETVRVDTHFFHISLSSQLLKYVQMLASVSSHLLC